MPSALRQTVAAWIRVLWCICSQICRSSSNAILWSFSMTLVLVHSMLTLVWYLPVDHPPALISTTTTMTTLARNLDSKTPGPVLRLLYFWFACSAALLYARSPSQHLPHRCNDDDPKRHTKASASASASTSARRTGNKRSTRTSTRVSFSRQTLRKEVARRLMIPLLRFAFCRLLASTLSPVSWCSLVVENCSSSTSSSPCSSEVKLLHDLARIASYLSLIALNYNSLLCCSKLIFTA